MQLTREQMMKNGYYAGDRDKTHRVFNEGLLEEAVEAKRRGWKVFIARKCNQCFTTHYGDNIESTDEFYCPNCLQRR